MKKLSLQSRIAFNYIVSTAILTGILCFIILLVFRAHTYRHTNEIMNAHVNYYIQGLSINNGQLVYLGQPDEDIKAGTRDKRTTYIEIFDNSGNVVFASSNLNGKSLPQKGVSFELNGEEVRVKKISIQIKKKTEGYFLIGVAAGDSELLMTILSRVCIVGFFFCMALLFVISRIIAQNSIKPIQEIIAISNTITHNNLQARIPMPAHKDELYELSDTINNLLDRIENAMEREKSFTSYASHEFRTPLSVLKGTMEVLIRRQRSEEEYKKKITACIKEVDKLNDMVEQLLILTRYEEGNRALNFAHHTVESLLHTGICAYHDTIIDKKLEIKSFIVPEGISIYTDEYSISIILKNLISNAVKYCNEGGTITCKASQTAEAVVVEIANTGHGIPEEEQQKIFEKFYRSYTHSPSNVKGFGLGLPIVKRFLLGIDVDITSGIDKITVAKLSIPVQ